MRRPLRAISTVLIIAGALMLSDAALTVLWQEPVSALYGRFVQGGLDDDLKRLELAEASAVDLAALRSLQSERRRMAFLARSWRRSAKRGEAIGRIRIPRMDLSTVIVDAADTGGDGEAAALRKGPAIYGSSPFPGAPGTVAIAGHRTTYLAPFRRVNELRPGNEIVVEMPYGRFTYRVQKTRIVDPTEVSVIRRVSYDRLVLSACHPLYSAAKRIIIFARFVDAQPRGPALT